jgi:peptidoglycan/xylan/chitin deacetylase (PgdA/CDA1 family)
MPTFFKGFFTTLAVAIILWPAAQGATFVVRSAAELTDSFSFQTDRGFGDDAVHPLQDITYSENDPRYGDGDLQLFDEPIISITFDDGWQSVYTNALPLLERYDMNSTQYITTGVVGAPAYMSEAQIRALQAGGHELAAHTVSHPDLTALSNEDLTSELVDSLTFLEERFGNIANMASPLNEYNDATLAEIQRHYASHRTTDYPYVNTRDSYDRYRIRALTIRSDTTIAEIETLIQQAKDEAGWLVLVYHQIDESGGGFTVTPAVFESHLDLISQSQIKTATVQQVLQAGG